MKKALIESPLGPLMAIADEQVLHRLEFISHCIVPEKGFCFPIEQLKEELKSYFEGTLKEFQTPLAFSGTAFQRKVWKELQNIGFGQTISYRELAQAIEKPTAYRAAAQANGKNPFVIVVPCHRVINSGGGLGGYSCGLDRKKWLLAHERHHSMV